MFEVYKRYNLNIVKGEGSRVYDSSGKLYLDFYGGHGVISIGHRHPHWVASIKEQLDKLPFYSNSVLNSLQEKLAEKLGELSGLQNYSLFMVNSGAEANENALKIASAYNGRNRVIAFRRGFHGRTAAALNVTDNDGIKSPITRGFEVQYFDFNQQEEMIATLSSNEVCAVIIEGIQGVGGIYVPDSYLMNTLAHHCHNTGTVLILDEVQSGNGRCDNFFAHQRVVGLRPDLITLAKGLGNGFPVGAVLINPKFKPQYGMLGTTFGGNHLACAAALACLEVLEKEKVIENARMIGAYLKQELRQIQGVVEVRGCGLMLGIEFPFPVQMLRRQLLFEHGLITGSAMQKNTLRLLPPLNISLEEASQCLTKIKDAVASPLAIS